MRQINDEALVARFPTLTTVLGEPSLRRSRQFIVSEWVWCELLEGDLSVLEPQTGLNKLIMCYRKDLRLPQKTKAASRAIENDDGAAFARAFGELRQTIFEIHGAALLARAGSDLDLHIPRGDGSRTNFDVQVKIHGYTVNADSKTRTDDFPFKRPPQGDNGSEPRLYRGERSTLDQDEARDLGISISSGNTPEHKTIREKLREARPQFPCPGYNLILLGQIGGCRSDLEDALWGSEYYYKGDDRPIHFRRIATGAFTQSPAGEEFRYLSGVLWIQLARRPDGIKSAYGLYANPYAERPLPDLVTRELMRIIDERREEGYRP